MSPRYLIALSVLLLGLLTAGWYLLAAPSRGSAVEPGAAGLVATAVQTGSSGWVRYEVTISDVGDQDWTGDVRLVSRHQSSGAPKRQNLPILQLPAPQPVAQGQVPTQVPDAALQAHVTVQSRHQRIVFLTGQDRYTTVELVGRTGQVIFAAPIELSTAIPVGVLSDSGAASAALAAVRIGELPLRVLSFSKSSTFPSSLLQLGGFAAVIVDQFDWVGLSPQQVMAIRDYVGLGGSLVVVGGTSWRRTLLPLPPDLAPIRPISTVSESLQPVAALLGGEAAPVAPVAAGQLAKQARVTLPGDPAPLMAELSYGAGRVVSLGFDPAADPLQGTKLAAAGWSQAVGRAVLRARAAVGWSASAIPAPSVAAAASLPVPEQAPLPPPGVLMLGLLGYLLLIGPVNLALSRRLRRPDLLWVTIPVVAVGATAGLYVAGLQLQGGTRDEQLQVLRVGPQGAVTDVEYHELLFGQRGQHRVQADTSALMAPMTLGIYQQAAADCPRCAQQLAGLPQNVAEHVVAGSRPTVIEEGVAYGNVRVVGAATTTHQALGVDAHLSVVQGRVQGTLANLSNVPLAALALYTYDGETYRRTELAAALAAGEQAQVDAQPRAVEVGSPAPGASVLTGKPNVADMVALAALSADPQPIILAFTRPLKSHLLLDGSPAAGAGIAVLEQPVRLESADASLKDWQQVRLLTSAGDPRGGYQSVYDIDVPAAPGVGLSLAYDGRQHSTVEIYNWRAGTWRGGPWGADPQNGVLRRGAVGPDEISAGMVRVRVKEPRLTWGAFVQVDVAG